MSEIARTKLLQLWQFRLQVTETEHPEVLGWMIAFGAASVVLGGGFVLPSKSIFARKRSFDQLASGGNLVDDDSRHSFPSS